MVIMNCFACRLFQDCFGLTYKSSPFEAGLLEARLYFRENDRKSQIFCRYEREGQQSDSCRVLLNLRISRKDSCLQLCEREDGRKWFLWANIRFTSYERELIH